MLFGRQLDAKIIISAHFVCAKIRNFQLRSARKCTKIFRVKISTNRRFINPDWWQVRKMLRFEDLWFIIRETWPQTRLYYDIAIINFDHLSDSILKGLIFADIAVLCVCNFRGDLISGIPSIFWLVFMNFSLYIGLFSPFSDKIVPGIKFCGFRGHFCRKIKSKQNLIPAKINAFKVQYSLL